MHIPSESSSLADKVRYLELLFARHGEILDPPKPKPRIVWGRLSSNVHSWQDLTGYQVEVWAAIACLQEEIGRPPRTYEILKAVDRQDRIDFGTRVLKPLVKVGWLEHLGGGSNHSYRAIEV